MTSSASVRANFGKFLYFFYCRQFSVYDGCGVRLYSRLVAKVYWQLLLPRGKCRGSWEKGILGWLFRELLFTKLKWWSAWVCLSLLEPAGKHFNCVLRRPTTVIKIWRWNASYLPCCMCRWIIGCTDRTRAIVWKRVLLVYTQQDSMHFWTPNLFKMQHIWRRENIPRAKP